MLARPALQQFIYKGVRALDRQIDAEIQGSLDAQPRRGEAHVAEVRSHTDRRKDRLQQVRASLYRVRKSIYDAIITVCRAPRKSSAALHKPLVHLPISIIRNQHCGTDFDALHFSSK